MADINDVSINSLKGDHIVTGDIEKYEAARSAFFTLMVHDIDNIVRADYTSASREEATNKDKIADASDALQLNVTAFQVPHFSIQPLEFKRGNDTIKFAGTPTFGSGKLTVDDVIGYDTKSILMAWQALAYDVQTRKGGRMKDYKKKCTLIEYTQDFKKIRSWDLRGCWVSEISEGDLDKGKDGKRQITATVQYDWAVMKKEDED